MNCVVGSDGVDTVASKLCWEGKGRIEGSLFHEFILAVPGEKRDLGKFEPTSRVEATEVGLLSKLVPLVRVAKAKCRELDSPSQVLSKFPEGSSEEDRHDKQ